MREARIVYSGNAVADELRGLAAALRRVTVESATDGLLHATKAEVDERWRSLPARLIASESKGKDRSAWGDLTRVVERVRIGVFDLGDFAGAAATLDRAAIRAASDPTLLRQRIRAVDAAVRLGERVDWVRRRVHDGLIAGGVEHGQTWVDSAVVEALAALPASREHNDFGYEFRDFLETFVIPFRCGHPLPACRGPRRAALWMVVHVPSPPARSALIETWRLARRYDEDVGPERMPWWNETVFRDVEKLEASCPIRDASAVPRAD